jgi:hypothetical protein
MSGDKKDGGIWGQIIVAGVVAILTRGTSPWWWDKLVSPSRNPPSSLLTPTSLPPASTPTQTAIRYDSISGNWVVIEKVKPEQGGWEIIWAFTADVYETSLTLRGNKKRVNGNEPILGEK